MSIGNEPAYPVKSAAEFQSHGLTKRELFVAMATQPGVAEIITAAGYFSPDGFNVWRSEDERIGTFTQWWAKLPNEERFRLASVVKIQQADALLAQLSKEPAHE